MGHAVYNVNGSWKQKQNYRFPAKLNYKNFYYILIDKQLQSNYDLIFWLYFFAH